MADDADMRAVLREHGHEPPSKGKLAPRWVDEYEQITHGATHPPADDDSGDTWDGPDDDSDIITAVIPDDAGPGVDEGEPVTAERRPRKVSSKPAGPSITDRIFGRKPKPKGRGKVKRAVAPHIPVDRLVGRLWSAAGRVVAPASGSAARAFMLQAPVAGVLVEDMVPRGTIVDRALQRAVRAEEIGEKVLILTAPVIVAMIERAQGLEEPRRTMQLAILFSMLEEALTLQVQFVGSDRMEAARARIEGDAETRAQVAELIAVIFPQAQVQDQPPQDANGQAPGAPPYAPAGAGEHTG